MAKPKVFVTRTLPEPAEEIVNENFDAEFSREPSGLSRIELLDRVGGKDALICQLTEKVDEELLAAAPTLKIASTVSVGYDNIDLAACTRRRVIATNTPGVLDDTTADFAFTLMLAVARRVVEGDRFVRSGQWAGWNIDQFIGADVWGKTLGVLGFGRIGREVARRARGFKMRVLYHNRSRVDAAVEREFHAEYADGDTLFRESDFISIHTPLSAATRHLVSAKHFAQMKPTAFLINTSRGPVVDEDALNDALERNVIAGAGLDVYEHEPKVHPGLIGRRNVVLAPHLGSATAETRTKMAVMAATNAATLFHGKLPANALNPEAFQK